MLLVLGRTLRKAGLGEPTKLYASDGADPAVLQCDYASCVVTVNGITYCDVAGFRNLDRVDVKPFIFRTEFTVKSWFFENIGV
jgi:hypothetical protein